MQIKEKKEKIKKQTFDQYDNRVCICLNIFSTIKNQLIRKHGSVVVNDALARFNKCPKQEIR